jgi:hypothetical protein
VQISMGSNIHAFVAQRSISCHASPYFSTHLLNIWPAPGRAERVSPQTQAIIAHRPILARPVGAGTAFEEDQ